MMPGRVRIVVSVSLITVITLTGSIALPFFILDKLDNKFVVVGNPHYNGFAILALALAMILISFLVGGAVWRWGITWLTKIKTCNLVKSGAIIWAVNVL